MNTPEDIRDTLELYLRGELDTAIAAKTASLLESDAAWQEIHAQILLEKRGVRFHSLQSFKNNLLEYETELINSEKNKENQGDLSHDPALNYTTNDVKGVEVKTQSHEMEENYSIDQNTEKGIRYSSLRGQWDKLKKEEAGMGGSALPKKNGGRVVGMRRYWWAVAAGVMILVFGGYYFNELNKPKYVNQYLMDHFDEYVLHDKVRSATPVDTFDRDKEIGYDLYVLQEFEEAIPYLERRWEEKRDTLALFYLKICLKVLGQREFKLKDKNSINSITLDSTLNNLINKLK